MLRETILIAVLALRAYCSAVYVLHTDILLVVACPFSFLELSL
jgi:hypothetical protein